MTWTATMPDEPGAYAICYAPDDFRAFMRRETGKGAVVEEMTEQEAIASMKARMQWTGNSAKKTTGSQGSKGIFRKPSTAQGTEQQTKTTGA